MKQNRVAAYIRFLCDYPRFFRGYFSLADCREELSTRLEQRDQAFLETARQAIYGNPSSPYLPLLREAGCEYGDLVRGIRDHGLEGLLERLRKAGVWISEDEFKGRTLIRRGSIELCPRPGDFDNFSCGGILGMTTGGSSGRAVRTRLDLDFLASRSCYDRVMMEMLGITGLPLAIWYPPLPASTGVGNLLRYARIGCPPSRWFSIPISEKGLQGWESRILTGLMIRLGRSLGGGCLSRSLRNWDLRIEWLNRSWPGWMNTADACSRVMSVEPWNWLENWKGREPIYEVW